MLITQQSLSQLPRRDIPVFTGDPFTYRSFIRTFEHAIDSKTDSQQDWLYYLEQFMSGEPLDLIHSCEHMRPDRAYREARALLDRHYGDELTIANAYIKKAMEWSQIKPDDRKGLNTFALFLIGCCNAVNDVDYMDEMNNPTNMKCILSKLSFKLKEKWRSYAYDIKERRKKRARFPDLVDFVYHQAKVVSDPLFGYILDATIGNQGNSKKKANVRKSETKRSSFTVSVCAMDKDTTKGQPERKPPAVNLANAFQSPCPYSGNLSKDCKKRASCPDCSLKHPTILHVVKEDPTLEKNRDGNSKDTAEVTNALVSAGCGRAPGSPEKSTKLMFIIVGVSVFLALILITGLMWRCFVIKSKGGAERSADVQTPNPGDDTYIALSPTTMSSDYDALTHVRSSSSETYSSLNPATMMADYDTLRVSVFLRVLLV
ncbi:hypothetical protein MHYP_G00203600 [Metynnis hypsauchen]